MSGYAYCTKSGKTSSRLQPGPIVDLALSSLLAFFLVWFWPVPVCTSPGDDVHNDVVGKCFQQNTALPFLPEKNELCEHKP